MKRLLFSTVAAVACLMSCGTAKAQYPTPFALNTPDSVQYPLFPATQQLMNLFDLSDRIAHDVRAGRYNNPLNVPRRGMWVWDAYARRWVLVRIR